MNTFTLTRAERRRLRESLSLPMPTSPFRLLIALLWVVGTLAGAAGFALVWLISATYTAVLDFVWYMSQGSRLMRFWFAVWGLLLAYLVLR